MYKNYKLTTIDVVRTNANKILEDGKSALTSKDSLKVKEFRIMLIRFIAKVRKGWMGKRYSKLSPENQEYLAKLIDELNKLDIETVNHILLTERGADLLVSLRKIEAPLHIPDEEKYDAPIDVSKWFYSSRLISELLRTEAPN
jgi:hypothetical protein